MQKIATFLWFDDKAEEAANFYVSVFKDAKILSVARYGEAGPGPNGAVMLVAFEIEGRQFYGLNGGPQFAFTPAISLYVTCESQEEVDALWEKLCDGGRPGRCGWLTDKYGLSWQIVPSVMHKLLQSGDAAKSGRVMKAMLSMTKIELQALKQAYEES